MLDWTRWCIGAGLLVVVGALAPIALAEDLPAESDLAPTWPAATESALIAPESDVSASDTLVRQPSLRPAVRRTRWDLTVEGSLSIFEDPDGILGVAPTAGTPTFNWSENSLESALGARATLGYSPDGTRRFEGRLWYSGTGEDDSRQSGRQFAYTPAPGGALTVSPAATADLENETDLWSLELNSWNRRCCTPTSRFETGFGLRWIQYTETASASNWVGLMPPNPDLENEAKNSFWAAQAMARYTWHEHRQLEVSLTAKGFIGVLSRSLSEEDTSIVTGGATTDAELDRTDLGWGLEAEVAARFRLSRQIDIVASYSLLYLNDISRGETTMDFSRAATGSVQHSNRTDDALIHSFFVGLRFNF